MGLFFFLRTNSTLNVEKSLRFRAESWRPTVPKMERQNLRLMKTLVKNGTRRWCIYHVRYAVCVFDKQCHLWIAKVCHTRHPWTPPITNYTFFSVHLLANLSNTLPLGSRLLHRPGLFRFPFFCHAPFVNSHVLRHSKCLISCKSLNK
jgi:hypothetical protein